MSNKKFNGSVNGKGYYIALILCAVAIGICGYLYTRDDDTQLSNSNVAAEVVVTEEAEDIEVVATQPTQTTPTQTVPPATQGKKPLTTVSPLQGQTVAVFAMDELQYNQTTRDWRVHNGVDIAAEAGTPVCAAADGEVYTVYEDDTMGMTVVICHADGYTTRYSSLAAEVSVQPGDQVKAGQTIGSVGQTALLESAIGDHLHFSVTCNDEAMDPEEFLDLE